ncbi:MAG: aspartate/glutamate racemase family protein [bacterium]|nr:aspartate/glutamate racemase family protein [bacterium]
MLGMFDSGIGVLTVVREFFRLRTDAGFVYLGDSARTPYGNKSPETIRSYALQDADFLIKQGATTIIVACNTVSAVAMGELGEAYPSVRFFDVITPAVEAARAFKKIGVIGTRATIQSKAYETRLRANSPCPLLVQEGVLPDPPLKLRGGARRAEELSAAEVYSVACPLFVPLVEEGWINKPETKRIARRYLAPLREKQIDALILGCTHYPLLQSVIAASLQRRVKIIDAPQALLDVLERSAPELMMARERQDYFFSDPSAHTDAIASRWLGRAIRGQKADLT